MADEHIRAGDSAFVDEDFHGALKAFSAALAVQPDDASVLAKRAATHLKLNDAHSALVDASAAVAKDSKNVKAAYHKGFVLAAT